MGTSKGLRGAMGRQERKGCTETEPVERAANLTVFQVY